MSGNDDYVRVPLAGDYDDEEINLDGNLESKPSETTQTSKEGVSPWNFEYYQRFFDVDTKEVLTRLAFSILPNPRANFVQHTLKPRADLYGPFWIATTLMMVAAMGSNVSSYFQSRGQIKSWHYDFQKVTFASTIVYIYWWLVPLALVAFSNISRRRSATRQTADGENDLTELLDGSQSKSGSRRRQTSDGYNLFTLLSVYGYSLTIFVPVSILWTIQNHPLQWILVAIAMGISGTFLVFALLPLFKREHPKVAIPLVTGVIVLHCAFAMLLMLVFFYGSSTNASSAVPPVQLPVQQQQQQPNVGGVAAESGKPGVPPAAPAADKVKRSVVSEASGSSHK